MKKRYPEVAERIMAELRSGEIRIGTSLPSEAVLCARFGVSRSTIRSALAELQRLGLIERKQGAATRVLSAEPPPTYVHSMLAAGDLMQFAGPSHRRVHSITPIVADERLGMWLEDKPGRRWIQISQTRHIADKEVPVGWTDIYLDETYADIAAEIADYHGLVYSLLEERHGILIHEIRQTIRATPVPEHLAGPLCVNAQTHALELRRYYMDRKRKNQIISISVLPSQHYTYEITLIRQG